MYILRTELYAMGREPTVVIERTNGQMVIGKKNNKPLADSETVILPQLYIKLGLIKQFVKANKGSSSFKYICNKFPELIICG